MTWAYPVTFWSFLLVPVLILAAVLSGRRARRFLNAIGKNSIEWQVRTFLRDLSLISFFILAVLAAAEPRGGRKPVTGERSGLDVAVAFDISRSMLAQDLIPSRLDRSVAAFRQVNRTLGDARFSLIPFKGDAVLAVPMTEDRVILDLWIGRLGPGLSTVPGTNVEAALIRAKESFPSEEGRNKVIILITDGEALTGRAERITRELSEAGIPVYALGAGTVEGSTIPLGDGSYVKDSSGLPVVTYTDMVALKRLSGNTGGSFHELSRPGAVADMIAEIDEHREFSESRGISFTGVNRFRVFLFPSLIFLLFFLLVRITPWRRR
ncbi:MAG: VWA domain-containing protein [Spirochaetaceae bacterium]|nr:VWA domain-containing protein [Spirochaetaceae bacterium]